MVATDCVILQNNNFFFAGSEYWMGLEKISKLTTSATFKLRLTMKKFSGETIIETYSTFKVANQVNTSNPTIFTFTNPFR